MIELTSSDAAFIGAAFTLIGGFIGALATVFSARLAAEKQQLYVESAKFRASFVEEIIKLRLAQEDAYKIISDASIIKHETAKTIFEAWISKKKRKAFDLAWSEYKNSIKTSSPGNISHRKNECELVTIKIEHLLSFSATNG